MFCSGGYCRFWLVRPPENSYSLARFQTPSRLSRGLSNRWSSGFAYPAPNGHGRRWSSHHRRPFYAMDVWTDVLTRTRAHDSLSRKYWWEEAEANKRRRGCNMTPEQLESLAIYRKHKECQCGDCQEARKALAEYDNQPRFGRSQTSETIQIRGPS